MNESKKILVTTLGASWQIIPELVGWTNPCQYDFFKENTDVAQLRTQHNINPVDEFWVVTTENTIGLENLDEWAKHWVVSLKRLVCKGIEDFSTDEQIRLFRSFLFRIVLQAKEQTMPNGKLYLSLAGGRKTMSVDMFDAATLFGCNALFHIADTQTPDKDDPLLTEPGKYANGFVLPIILEENIKSSFIISGGEKQISPSDFPIDTSEPQITFVEDGALEKEIAERKHNSAQVYANYYNRIRNSAGERDIFRQLYFLHPNILQILKETIIGNDYEKDIALLKSLPKADLHTHLGGVLSAAEIIEVAKAIEESKLRSKSKEFQGHIDEILKYDGCEDDFDKHIFGNYVNRDNYYKTGINPYQKLGDYQGSSLLQTKETISKAVDIYARNLIADNVQYVEIRCSPYKYTKEGLTASEVISIILDAMDKYSDEITYRIICIVGRQSGYKEIQQSINEIVRLMDNNTRFCQKLVGIDLAGDESAKSPQDLRGLFMPFLEKCVHITIHAGETQEVDSIWQAVYHLNADRIGHGLRLLDKEEIIPRFIDKNIGIEMCPSSNRQIVGYGRISDKVYPLKAYMQKGLKVTINTDNQGISRTSLSNEFFEAARLVGGLSIWECIVLIRNSIIVSFADNETKLRLIRNYERMIYDWCNKLIN